MADIPDDGFHAALICRASEALKHWAVPQQEAFLLKYRENAVFRITLADGQFAALRLHRSGYHGLETLLSELDWMAALNRDGIDIPHALPASSGQFVIELPASDHFSAQYADVISWVEGDQFGETGTPMSYPQQERDMLFRQIGAKMADMHNSADAWTPTPGFHRPSWNAAGLLGEQPLWGRFWDCALLTDDEKHQLSTLRDRLDVALAEAIENGSDYGLIHADLIRENVMVNGTRISFIDFDDCGYGFRMFDIATTLLKNASEPNYDDLQTALISGYRDRRTLSDAELATLPLFLALRSLTYIGWLAGRKELPDAPARMRRYVSDSLRMASCLVSQCDGVSLTRSQRDTLWANFFTAAPRPCTPFEQSYSDRKLQPRRSPGGTASTKKS